VYREEGTEGDRPHIQGPCKEVEEEQHEVSVVVIPHTIAHPGAEVVHVKDALPGYAGGEINQRSEMTIHVRGELYLPQI
jgi:hypothetical protein